MYLFIISYIYIFIFDFKYFQLIMGSLERNYIVSREAPVVTILKSVTGMTGNWLIEVFSYFLATDGL